MNPRKKQIQEGEDYQELKGKATISEILETASSFEKTAMNFYIALQDKVSKRLHSFIQELADEEKHHFELFQHLDRHPQVSEQIKELIKIPSNDHRFSDYIQIPELSEFPDDQAILQYAMGREQAAMEQYSTLAEETPAGPIRDLFRYLAQQELQHKKELEKRYYEVVHKTG